MFLNRVRDETGIDVRVVDGHAEAVLTFRGLAADTDLTGSVWSPISAAAVRN